MRRNDAWIPALLLAGAAFGCGARSPFPETIPVSGKVSIQGRQVTKGTVIFQSDQGHLAVGEIQPDGTFHLSTAGDRDGATLGHHRVSIISKESDPALMPGTSRGYTQPRDLIPKRYSQFETSGLEEVVSKEQTYFNLELKP